MNGRPNSLLFAVVFLKDPGGRLWIVFLVLKPLSWEWLEMRSGKYIGECQVKESLII